MDNVIPTQVRVNLCGGPYGVGAIKTTKNIRIYRPREFCVRSGTNQSYSMECDWKCFSPSSTHKVKGRTPGSIKKIN